VLAAVRVPFVVNVPVNEGDVAHNAGLVTNTSLVSEPNDTNVPAPLELASTLPEERVIVVAVASVPRPTSQVANV
jgi:hypothetical protein